MKTKIIPLTGDLKENLYQLGLSEKESFQRLEERVQKLLSTSSLLRQGQDIITRARFMIKKKKDSQETFFESCVKAYAEGLGRDLPAYLSFLSLFEIAAHYGHSYPELRSILPGCTSLFTFSDNEASHSRLIDFPLIGILEATPRLYLWQAEGKPTVLSYSCEGLAPLFFQVIHDCGLSLAIHHKPGINYFKEGVGIFQLTFELMMENKSAADIRRELKKKQTQAKWSVLLLEKSGRVDVYDIEGPSQAQETFNLSEAGPLIFTNIPLKKEKRESEGYLEFCNQRQSWLKQKLTRSSKLHVLDALTDIKDQKEKKWVHPSGTLSTTAAITINLTKGWLDVKEGESALVAADSIVRFSLADHRKAEVLKPQGALSDFESAWKKASRAQASFDAGEMDIAYHELQMAQALIPHQVWKDIFQFYLCVWDFRNIQSSKELSHVYKSLRKLDLPAPLKSHAKLMCMRLERKLGLQIAEKSDSLTATHRDLFDQETHASKPIFLAWMKLIYPRLEILDVFSPHLK